MDKPTANVRPEILALGTLIESTIDQASGNETERQRDGWLFVGYQQTAFPVRLVQDPVLEPVDKLVWMAILLQSRASSAHTAFPSYDYIQKTANIASRSTVARSIAVLRATRWLTLYARIRKRSGRFGGTVFALHDEPLSLEDVMYLDTGYMTFLRTAQRHAHAQVRMVANSVLESLDADGSKDNDDRIGQCPLSCKSEGDSGISNHGTCSSSTSNPGTEIQQHATESQELVSAQPSSSRTPLNDLITGEAGSPLVYPKCLDENQWVLTNHYLAAIAPEQRQPILDELDGRLRSVEKGMSPLYDEMSYLNSLCKAMREGKFKLKLGASVQAERAAREKVRERRRHSSSGALNPDPRELRAQIEAGTGAFTKIRQYLGQSRRTLSHPPDQD